MALTFQYGDKTVQEFILLYKNGQLNLDPGFQRASVWSPNDRKKLLVSIFQKYPIPSVFLYTRNERGKLMYDVIEGKQRLESILMFQGVGEFKDERFSTRARIDSDPEISDWDWRRIVRKGHAVQIMNYNIQTVEVAGEFSEIVELFVRINSTGKRLTGAERRHARFYRTDFLREASRLAERYTNYLMHHRILSRGQISRMKHVELVSELLASLYEGNVINKKKALDNLIGGHSVDTRSLKRLSKELVRTLNLTGKMFPEIRSTRFANAVDFYSLSMLVWEMDQQGLILTDERRNRQAQKLLIWLSDGVDRVRQKVRRAEGAGTEEQLFRDYLLTVQGDTDSQATRKRRGEILRQVLGGLFEKKDTQRNFTPEQRRLIWNSNQTKRCKYPKCGEVLTWNNFTIDHRKSHARGGTTTLSNADLMCRKHNSAKGASKRKHA